MEVDNKHNKVQNGSTGPEVVKPATDADEEAKDHKYDLEDNNQGKAKGSAANAFRRVKAEDWLG